MSDPVTAPELVETVAEVLRVHGFTELEHGYWYCSCGHELGVPIPDDLHAAHQARAVLAALTEAGNVEWGVQTKTFMDGDYDNMITAIQYRRITREVAQDHVDAMNSRYPIARVVSRLTLPWGRAE